MAEFVYTATDRTGKLIKGKGEFTDRQLAIEHLRGQGYFVVTLEEAVSERGEEIPEKKRRSALHSKVRATEIMIFTRQLASMLAAGVSIIKALDALISKKAKKVSPLSLIIREIK